MLSPVKIWRNQKKIASLLGMYGVVLSYTRIVVPPAGFSDLAPYYVVLVQMDDASKLTAQLVDFQTEENIIGMRVRTVVRRMAMSGEDGVIPYGIKVTAVV